VFSFVKLPDKFWGPPNFLSSAYRISFEGLKLVFVKISSPFYPVPNTRSSASIYLLPSVSAWHAKVKI